MAPVRPAVFLDRDGVLNDLAYDEVDGRPESPLHPDQVKLADGAVRGLKLLRASDRGHALVVVSNQPAAAKGKASMDDLRAVHGRLVDLLAEHELALDGFRYCFHRREDECDCRKPKPGMLLELAAEHDLDLGASWMVGDTDADVGAGQAAGTRTVLVEHPDSAHKRSEAVRPDGVARNLEEAAALLLSDTSPSL